MDKIIKNNRVNKDDYEKEVIVNFRGVTSDSVVMSLAAYKEMLASPGELTGVWNGVRDYATGMIDMLPTMVGDLKSYEGGYDSYESFTAVHDSRDINDLESLNDRLVINERVVQDTSYLVHPVSDNIDEVREALVRYVKGEKADNTKFILEEIESVYVPDREYREVEEYRAGQLVGSIYIGSESAKTSLDDEVENINGVFSVAWEVVDNE